MTQVELFDKIKLRQDGNVLEVFRKCFPVELEAGYAACWIDAGNPNIAKNPMAKTKHTTLMSPEAMAWNFGWNYCWERNYLSNQMLDPEPYPTPSNCA